ncbi:hypothetical protein D3C77_557180 [compost metagenome]
MLTIGAQKIHTASTTAALWVWRKCSIGALLMTCHSLTGAATILRTTQSLCSTRQKLGLCTANRLASCRNPASHLRAGLSTQSGARSLIPDQLVMTAKSRKMSGSERFVARLSFWIFTSRILQPHVKTLPHSPLLILLSSNPRQSVF